MPYKYVPKTRSKGKNDRTHWDTKKKLDLIQAYIITGNLRLSAATLGVPEDTARVWKATQFWKDTEDELRRGSKLELSAKLGNLVNKSMEALADRVVNGDYQMRTLPATRGPDGKLVPGVIEWIRRPITAEVANKITAQLIDRTLAIEKTALVEKQTDVGLEARLTKIQQDIARFAKQGYLPPSVQGQVIDAEPVATTTEAPNTQTNPTPDKPAKPALEYTYAAQRMGLSDPNQPRVTEGVIDNG